jgi:hypothetical protein
LNESTHPDDRFDPRLETLFRQEHQSIPIEPFVGATLKRIAAERARVHRVRRLIEAAALIAVIVASPWLIEASVLISAMLDEAFALVSAWLETPSGTTIAIFVGALLAALFRLRVSG